MGRLAEKILDALEADVRSRQEWDEPPCLCLLRVDGGECEVRPQPLPDYIWASAPPSRVLSVLADGYGQFTGILQAAAPEGLYGVALRCEMWEVSAAPGTDEAASAEADANERKLWTRPDRIETRAMWAVDRAGATYDVTLQRESGDIRRHVVYPKPGVQGFSGLIPEALDKIVTALLGVPMPARPGMR